MHACKFEGTVIYGQVGRTFSPRRLGSPGTAHFVDSVTETHVSQSFVDHYRHSFIG